MQLITLEDKRLHNFAIVDPVRRKIIWASGELFKLWLPKILASSPKLRVEVFDSVRNTTVTYLREVKDDEPDFASAWREEFQRRGIHAELTSSNGSTLQMILRQSFLSKELQDRIIYNLSRLTNTQIQQMLSELKIA